jgi:hypothetical protein
MTLTTAGLAEWLANNVPAIANNEQAGQCYADIKQIVDDIERMINRPIPPRFVGPCPTLLDDGYTCDTSLMADRKATEVTCPQCKTTHNVEEVGQQLWERVGEWLLSTSEIHMVMEHLGEPVPAGTIRRWQSEGKLKPRGWREEKARYWPNDVRELRRTRLKTTRV